MCTDNYDRHDTLGSQTKNIIECEMSLLNNSIIVISTCRPIASLDLV